jgi:hypothetical protein
MSVLQFIFLFYFFVNFFAHSAEVSFVLWCKHCYVLHSHGLWRRYSGCGKMYILIIWPSATCDERNRIAVYWRCTVCIQCRDVYVDLNEWFKVIAKGGHQGLKGGEIHINSQSNFHRKDFGSLLTNKKHLLETISLFQEDTNRSGRTIWFMSMTCTFMHNRICISSPLS